VKKSSFAFPRRLILALTIGLIPIAAHAAADTDLVKRGEYLTRAGDCQGCHTAKGGVPFAGGLYMGTPFGEIATPNITPDKETGIGDWSDDDFYRALHEGIRRDKSYLYPVFPFPWYTKVTRDDALAIKAYLFSLAPQHAPQKKLLMPFPFDDRELLEAWRLAFFKESTFQPDPKQSAEVNRGAYLVEGLGHCGECHNHNNLFGASYWSGRLEGGQIEDWYAPNITPSGHQGIATWTDDQLVTFLKTGVAPGKGIALGPMQETIDDSLHYLTEQDLHAMVAYLRSVTPKADQKTETVSAPSAPHSTGAELYVTNCASCHRLDGRGVPGRIPALANDGAVLTEGPQNVIRVILGGLESSHGMSPMPAIGDGLSDNEVAEIANYVRTSWGNQAPANAQAGTVGNLRKETHTLLAGYCDNDPDPKLSKLMSSANLQSQLQGVNATNMLDRIDQILPKVKSAGASDNDVVNAMTAAYCQDVMGDKSLKRPEQTALLGRFSVLVYGQDVMGGKKN
jgi:mono/diheme cytochrome c family protein